MWTSKIQSEDLKTVYGFYLHRVQSDFKYFTACAAREISSESSKRELLIFSKLFVNIGILR